MLYMVKKVEPLAKNIYSEAPDHKTEDFLRIYTLKSHDEG